MSYSPPEPPSPERKSLDFDEFVAVVIAFISIGLILLWGLSRKETRFGTAAWRLLEKQSQVETASVSKPSGEQPSEISSLEVYEQASPFQIFQSQPDTPDKFAELRHSELLSGLHGEQQPPLNKRAAGSFSIVSEAVGPPNQAGSNVAVQLDGDESEPFVLGKGDAPGLGDDLPVLPSQPLEQPIDSTELIAIAPLTVSIEFPDVSDQYWATAFIDALSARELLSGFPNGTFQPDKPMTRAELAAQISKVFTLAAQQKALNFEDIPETYWAASEIKKTVIAGFMRGYPAETFKPDQSVSRVQVLVAIVSGLGLTLNAEPMSVLRRYQDWDEIPNWAIAKVATATEIGLVVNYPNLERFRPNQPATRAEVAAIMNRALVHLGKLEDFPSSYVVRP